MIKVKVLWMYVKADGCRRVSLNLQHLKNKKQIENKNGKGKDKQSEHFGVLINLSAFYQQLWAAY